MICVKRLDSQEIAKGLMIFFAVMMHTVRAHDAPVWRVAISTFHVPLFFLVSGIAVGRAKSGWAACVRNNAFVLLLPYFAWALIYTPFKLELLPWILYGNWAALNRIGSNTALWFLPAIFCARLMFEAVMQLIERFVVRRVPAVLLAALISSAVGMVLPNPSIGYPLGFHAAIIALGFLLIGSMIDDCLKAAERLGLRAVTCLALVLTALFAYGAFLRPGEHVLVGIAEFKLGSRFWFFWNAVFGWGVVLSYAVIMSFLSTKGAVTGSVRRFLVWLGHSAIGVLILHVPISRHLVSPCLLAIGLDSRIWYCALINAVITMAISCPLIYAAQRYAPKLSGVLGLRMEKTSETIETGNWYNSGKRG